MFFRIMVGLVILLLNQDLRGQFSAVFKPEDELELNQGKTFVAYFWDFVVDEQGRYFVIDFAGKKVVCYDEHGHFIRNIGGPGKGPGEFQAPVCAAWGPDDVLYVADNALRRINIFDQQGNFLRSFIVAGTHWMPRVLRVDSQGHVFMAGLKENFDKPFTGTWLQEYDSKGRPLRSFYDVEDFSVENNLSYHSMCSFDLTNQGYIFAVQSAVPKITVFDTAGKHINSIPVNSKFFINPERFPKPREWVHLSSQTKQQYLSSWTKLNRIAVAKDSLVVLSLQMNGLSQTVDSDYLIYLYDKRGHLITPALPTNFRLLYADSKGFVYFLTRAQEEAETPRYTIGKFKVQQKGIANARSR